MSVRSQRSTVVLSFDRRAVESWGVLLLGFFVPIVGLPVAVAMKRADAKEFRSARIELDWAIAVSGTLLALLILMCSIGFVGAGVLPLLAG